MVRSTVEETMTGENGEECTIQVQTNKIVVVCIFQELMKILENFLKKSCIGYCKIDGKTENNQRKDDINLFKTDPSKKVFLLALTAGGMGINLQIANVLFIVDQWWNPGKTQINNLTVVSNYFTSNR
jgi:SNF2 family DNA or RNA helicase